MCFYFLSDEYSYLLDHIVNKNRDPFKILFLLRHLTYLPTYRMPPKLLDMAIRRLVKEHSNHQIVLDLARTIRDTDAPILKQVSSSSLQQFVNTCQKLINSQVDGQKDKNALSPVNFKAHLAPTLHRLLKVGIDNLALDLSIQLPPESSQFEHRISTLVAKGKWAELEKEYRVMIKGDKTLSEVSTFMAAILEAFIEAESPTAIDKNFAALVDVLTIHHKIPLLPVEKALLAQLAGTLLVHIENMPA